VLTSADLAALVGALESDPHLRERFGVDPVAAAREAGMDEIGSKIENEIRGLLAVAERVANDDAYRDALGSDPVGTLGAAGIPGSTVEPFLRALDVSDDVLDPLPEVVGHGDEPSPRARAVLLLLGSDGVVARIRATSAGR
jgi:hypothetical protein